MSELKEIEASLVVYDSQMFLRISIGEEQVDLPYEEATKFKRKIVAMVPYRYGQPVWFTPLKFTGLGNAVTKEEAVKQWLEGKANAIL